MLIRSNPSGIAAPIGKYHHATTVPAGSDLVFISGQIGSDPDGRVLRDPVDQARAAFANIGVILADLDVGPGHIAKLLTFVAGADNVRQFFTVRDEVFAGWYPDGAVPSHSLAVVAGLADPELLVEIEAVVAVPRS